MFILITGGTGFVVVKTIMGELGASFLNSQRVVSEKIINKGFEFQFPDIH